MSEEFADDEHDKKPLCHAKNGDTAQLLIDNDPDESLFEPGPDTPVIHYVIDSVAKGCIDISSLRISSKYDQTLNQDYGDEGYAIHCGVRTGKTEIVSILIDAGAEINLLSNDGESAIGIAAMKGDKEMVQFLIDNGSGLGVSDFFFADSDYDEDDLPEVDEPIDLAVDNEIKDIIKQASKK